MAYLHVTCGRVGLIYIWFLVGKEVKRRRRSDWSFRGHVRGDAGVAAVSSEEVVLGCGSLRASRLWASILRGSGGEHSWLLRFFTRGGALVVASYACPDRCG